MSSTTVAERFYVWRSNGERFGYVGPMPKGRAIRECDAWQRSGWEARTIRATPDIRKLVNAWQRERDIALGRRAAA